MELWVGLFLGVVTGHLLWRFLMRRYRFKTTKTRVTHIILDGKRIKLDNPIIFRTTH